MFQLFGSNSISVIDQNTLKAITNGQTYQRSINYEQQNNQENALNKIEFAKRPDYGQNGRKIRLEVNHFKLILPSITIFHYDFKIHPLLSKNLNRLIYDKILLDYNQLFNDTIIIYDNEDNLYSKTFLPIGFDKIEFEILLGKKKKFNISIQFKGQLNLDLLKDILNRKLIKIPDEIVNCVDSIMRNIPNKDKYISIDKSFFNITNSFRNSLGSGKEVGYGWVQQCVPACWSMTMKIDASATAFYKSQSVINFICETLDFSFLDKRRCLNDFQRQKLLKEIKGLKIEINYGNTKRRYRVVNILKKPLYLQTFILNQDNGIVKEVYLVNYYKEKYNIDLEYVNLPCLHVAPEDRQILLPLELCVISKGQRCLRRLTDTQISTMIRSTAISATDRRNEIKKIVKQVNFNNDKSANDFGFMVNDEMEQIEGRVIDSPLLLYRGSVVNPVNGKWNLARKRFYYGKVIQKYAIVCFSHIVKEQAIRNFIQQLTTAATNVGMQINSPPCFCKYADNIKQVEPIFSYLKTTFPTIQLIIFILPGKTAIYSEIKRLGDLNYGLCTQCIQYKNVNNCTPQTLCNILMKINVKLNGINLILNPEDRPAKFNEPIVIFGANLSRLSDPKSPAVCSVVSSLDGYPIKYAARIRVQIGIDEIVELSTMVKELLLQFYKETNFKPHRIVFYRQGITNLKHLKTIFYNELTAIRNSCFELENGNYRPGITYINVQKRHHTRLFCKDQFDEEGGTKNIPPGVALDNSIVNPTEFDFYLCSHSGVQGTSRPSYYHVLHDDNRFSADEIQILTYQLCHTYARCTRSVSVPAPAYYSQLATKQAKNYLILDNETLRNKIIELQKENNDNIDPNDIFNRNNNQETLEAFSKILKLHENTLSTMYFI